MLQTSSKIEQQRLRKAVAQAKCLAPETMTAGRVLNLACCIHSGADSPIEGFHSQLC